LQIDGNPASPELLAAIQQIDVEDHAVLADIMRLRIAAAVREDGGGWTVIDDDFFPRLAHLRLVLTVGAHTREVLIDAYVIETRVEFSNQPGKSVIDVVAMDPTVLMSLEEKVRPWPGMTDDQIASTIFGEYGFAPQVESTQPARQETDVTTIQRGSDIAFLRRLAARNGFQVYVEVNPQSGETEGHFHPERLEQEPQGVLSVNLGATTNVNTFQARFDMLRPTTVTANGLDAATHSDQATSAETISRPGLGGAPALAADRPRRVLLSQTGLTDAGELQTLAQAVADQSSWAIVAEGELNTAAYGGILRAKRPISVRGAGRQYSGQYYVERVLHTIADGRYIQSFSLRRNGVGLTGEESFVEDNALP
jgi:phage protein D